MNNIIENNYKSSKPEVGMGATELMYSDRHLFTVISVSANGKKASIQMDNAKRIDDNGMSEMQTYEYSPNVNAEIREIGLCKDGHWHMGGTMKGRVVMLGRRQKYYDYSF